MTTERPYSVAAIGAPPTMAATRCEIAVPAKMAAAAMTGADRLSPSQAPHCHPEMPSHSFVEQLLATRKSAPISRSLRVHCALRRTHIMAAMDLMAAMDRFAFTMASLLALTLAIAAARAEEPGRPVRTSAGHVCLDQKER